MASNKNLGYAALAMLVVSIAALGQPARLVSSGASLTIPATLEGKRIPVWSGNALVVAEGPFTEPNAFWAFDRGGALVFNAAFYIPEAAHTYVRNWARGADGTLALCGSSFASDGRGAPFIAWISADGVSQEVIRTEPYTPNLIAVSPDGTFWTVGRELNSRLSERSGVDLNAGVVRHFDRSGKTLGAFMPRSSLRNPGELGANSGYLAASAERVGWFHYDVEANGKGAYVEISPGGDITSYPIPRLPSPNPLVQVSGMAMTDSGDVFVVMYDVGAHTGFSIFRLNRSTKDWSPVTLSGVTGDFALLYGASGSDLAFRVPGDPLSTVRFFSAGR